MIQYYTYIGGWRVTYTHLGTSEIWLKAFKPTSFKWTANRIRRSIFAISCFDRNLCMTPNGQEVWRKSKVVASRSEIVHLTWSLLWRLWRWDAKIGTTLNVCWQTHFPSSNTCHEKMIFEIFSHHHHHHHHHHHPHHHHPPSFTFPSSRNHLQSLVTVHVSIQHGLPLHYELVRVELPIWRPEGLFVFHRWCGKRMPQAAMIFGDSVEPDQMYHLPYVTHDQFNSETYIDIIYL